MQPCSLYCLTALNIKSLLDDHRLRSKVPQEVYAFVKKHNNNDNNNGPCTKCNSYTWVWGSKKQNYILCATPGCSVKQTQLGIHRQYKYCIACNKN